MEIEAVAVSRRPRPPTYQELYGDRRRAQAAAPPRPARGAPIPLLAFLALTTLGVSGVAMRVRLVAQVPALAPAFAAIGLPVNLRGLELRDVKATVFADKGRETLGVEGEIVNLRDRTAPIPRLRFSLRTGDGREIYVWTGAAQVERIERRGTVLFRARLASPPDRAHDVLVRFAEGSA